MARARLRKSRLSGGSTHTGLENTGYFATSLCPRMVIVFVMTCACALPASNDCCMAAIFSTPCFSIVAACSSILACAAASFCSYFATALVEA